MTTKTLATPTLSSAQLAPSADGHDILDSDHLVQFYETDTFLVESVSKFMGAGLGTGQGGIVIATAAHREALEARLRTQGIDIAGVKARGQFLSLDAAETLSKFMVNGSPDPERFQKVIGSVIARMSSRHTGLRAFGEMVALLWADGSGDAAIRLEQLWNELAEEYSFSLFCAYPMNGFGGTANGEAFAHICHEHSLVLPAESYGAANRTADERLRNIACLQQKANSLEAEIEKRKCVEADLRRSKEELTTFIENISLGLHWVGADGVILWANAAEYEMLGYTREEYIGHSITEFHADREVIEDILNRLNRGEKLHNQEARLKCKDGSIKTVLIDSSVLWENGRFVHTQCFTRDITEQKLAEKTGRLYAAIVESSEDAIISKDLNGIINSWNAGAQRMFGYTASEIIGKPILVLIPPDHYNEEPNIVDRIRRGQRIEHYETIRRRKDGSLIEISLTVSPVKNAAGQIIGASKIVRDITEQKRNERALTEAHLQLAKAKDELELRVQERTSSLREAITQMEEFSYSVSHDLRAPVRAMRCYAEVLLEDYGERLDDHAKKYLDRIVSGGTRMDRLIEDILTYSRLNRREIQLQPVALDRLVREIVQQYPEMRSARAEIVIQGKLLSVIGHEPSLTQAISNLLNNAVKFVASGVTPRVRIRTERRDDQVRLWIEDNGIGIKPEYQHRLFGMFERIHPEKSYEGTGIGLAIVRKAAERMGGKAGVESDGLTGSNFWIQLPPATNP
ncbi:MAG: hypothetical protein QOD03_981 [Verrucomicrobiota bacterium]|jgi:PAS domain S-box-containing protein